MLKHDGGPIKLGVQYILIWHTFDKLHTNIISFLLLGRNHKVNPTFLEDSMDVETHQGQSVPKGGQYIR